MFTQQIVCGSIVRWGSLIILNEITEYRIFFIICWRFQGKRTSCDLDHVLNLFGWNIQRNSEFFHAGFAAETLGQLVLNTQQFIDLITHMHRYTDGASLIGDRAGDRLANPPRCVRGEFMSTAVIKLFGRADQTDVTFLNQIQEWNTTSHVLLCYRDHQTRVGCDQVFTSRPTILDQFAQFRTAARAGIAFCKFLTRHSSALDALSQFYFLLRGQERYTA